MPIEQRYRKLLNRIGRKQSPCRSCPDAENCINYSGKYDYICPGIKLRKKEKDD